MRHFTNIFKACINSGQPHKGVSLGPDRIVPLLKNTSSVRKTHKGVDLYNMIKKETSKTDKILTLGGDHSVASYSIASQLAKYEDPEDFGVIWFDTHADINTRESSTSGNTHGMPVSFLLGYEEVPHIKFPKLRPENIVYIGPRDIDHPEQRYLNQLGIKVYRSDEILRSNHIPKIMHETLNMHLGDCKHIHLSFDVDVMDPDVFPCTGTPVKGGLDMIQTKHILNEVMEDPRFVSMDVVEYNPELSPEYAVMCEKVLKYLLN